MSKLDVFIKLSQIFEENGYRLYLVGGTVRDYLSATPLTDMDAVTTATPNQMKLFLSEYKTDFTFAKMGSIKVYFDEVRFDVVTLRKEKGYKDNRHPTEVKFIKSLRVDSRRRDFTLNAMYLDNTLTVYDYHSGRRDLRENILKMVGNPNKRIKEDPLRIIRALRFHLTYNYRIDKKLLKALNNNSHLVLELNQDKVSQEISKIKNVDEEKIRETFSLFNIKYPEKVIK